MTPTRLQDPGHAQALDFRHRLSLFAASSGATPTLEELLELDSRAHGGAIVSARAAPVDIAFSCEWVTLYDYQGDGTTVWQCY